MKVRQLLFNFGAFGAAAIVVAASSLSAHAAIIRTTWNNQMTGAGQTNVPADAELREEAATTVRGDNQELATRGHVPSAGDATQGTQNSWMLMRFDISGITLTDLANNPDVRLRLHVDTQNWVPTNSYLPSTTPPEQYGLEYWALNTSAPGQNWDEGTVTYNTAPGILNDNSVATHNDQTADMTKLGQLDFQPVHVSNFLPVGTPWDFQSPALTAYITNAVTNGVQFVTIMAGRYNGRTNQQYIFSSNDDVNLLSQTNYDPDGSGPMPGGQTVPNSGASAAGGKFAPKLILAIPEPASLALFAFGIVALANRQRRK